MNDALTGFAACLGTDHFLTLCARNDLSRLISNLSDSTLVEPDENVSSLAETRFASKVILFTSQVPVVREHFRLLGNQIESGRFLLLDDGADGLIRSLANARLARSQNAQGASEQVQDCGDPTDDIIEGDGFLSLEEDGMGRVPQEISSEVSGSSQNDVVFQFLQRLQR